MFQFENYPKRYFYNRHNIKWEISPHTHAPSRGNRISHQNVNMDAIFHEKVRKWVLKLSETIILSIIVRCKLSNWTTCKYTYADIWFPIKIGWWKSTKFENNSTLVLPLVVGHVGVIINPAKFGRLAY